MKMLMRFSVMAVMLFFHSSLFSEIVKDTTPASRINRAEYKNPADSTIVSMNPVIVTASRKIEYIAHSLTDITYAGKQHILRNNSRSTPEILAGTAGVWMQKTNHASGSPFIRGLTGNQVLTLIDGIRLNNATFRYGPNQYLVTIDPMSVQRIEVMRSTGSMLYGSDAIGGVINVISETPKFSENKTRVNGFVSAKLISSDMEQSNNGGISVSAKNIAWNTQASWSDFGDIVAADGKKQTPTSYSQKSVSSKLVSRLNEKQMVTFCYQYLTQGGVDLYDQVTQRDYAISVIGPQLRHLGYVRWTAHFGNPLFAELQVTVSDHFSEESRKRQKNNSPIRTEENDKVNTVGIILDATSKFNKNWSANSGIDFYFDKVKSNAHDFNTITGEATPKRGLYPDGSTMSSLAIFHQQQYQRNKLFFQGGLRANFYKTEINDAKFGNVNINPSAIVGNFGVRYHLGDEWNLVGQLSTGFRAPNINDLSTFGKFDFGIEVPSPHLEPERSFNKELGIKKVTDRLLISFTAFHNKLTNLIDRVKTSYEADTILNGDRVFTKQNVGTAVIRGLEWEFNMKLNSVLRVSGHFAYAYGQNVTANEPVRRIPPFFGKLSGEHQPFKNFYYAVDWLFAGEQNRLAEGDMADHRINPKGTPGWGILNLRAGVIFSLISIQAGVENILDQSYRIHGSGIDNYGINAWFRTTIAF